MAGNKNIEKILQFSIENNSLIATTSEIHSVHLREFLERYIHTFADGTVFDIYCGSHGAEDGNLGQTSFTETGDMITQYRSMISYLTTYNKRTMNIIDEKDFLFEVKPIGEVPSYELDESHFAEFNTIMENMMVSERPHVAILAFCFTDISILKTLLMESGILPILFTKELLNLHRK